jgi:3-methyladenine DNA glycosylase/8-oxoguanine DNA glycosylase
VAALRDLAAKSLDGTLPSMARLRAMEDEAIVERLTVVRGIGRWTAEMFLMFRLGRPDVLPVHDYGVRKGFQLAFGRREIPKPESVARRGERWRPYRTVASWYLWRGLE